MELRSPRPGLSCDPCEDRIDIEAFHGYSNDTRISSNPRPMETEPQTYYLATRKPRFLRPLLEYLHITEKPVALFKGVRGINGIA